MAVIETWLRQDLKGLVTVRSLQGQVFSLDNGGNLIGVKVTKDYKPVTLTGTVTGYCILSDGQTVTVTGSGNAGIQNVNEAYIVLPQLAYSVPGQISIVIKITNGSTTTTLAACTGYVYKSRTSNEVVPPGTPIPDLSTLEEVIRRATAATDSANTAASSANNAATAAENVNVAMSKSGKVITITTTNRNNTNTTETITEPSLTVTKEGQTITLTATDADGTTEVEYDAVETEDVDEIRDDIRDLTVEVVQKAPAISDDASGSIATFESDTEGVPLKSCVVEIEPMQDLHGYDNPWPAGGGKNLLPPIETKTDSGVTFTQDGDYIKISGTPSGGNVYCVLFDDILPAGTYTLNGVEGASSQSYRTGLKIADDTSWTYNSTTQRTFTLEAESRVQIWLFAYPGYGTFDNVKVQYQFERGDTVTPWTPYSNICPISGWTGAKVTRTGKNLVDVSDQVNVTNGTKIIASGLPTGGFLTASADISDATPDNGLARIRIQYMLNDNLVVSSNATIHSGHSVATLQIPQNATDVKIVIQRNTATTSFSAKNVMVEHGQTASTYEPYQGETYDITFPTEAGTVYGGTLDVVSGKLTVDRAMVEITNESSFVWNSGNSLVYVNVIGGIKTNNTTQFNKYTQNSMFTDRPWSGRNLSDGTVGMFFGQSSIYIKYSKITSTNDAIAFFTNNPMTVVYDLATPVIVDLTSQDLETLLGVNNVFASTGDIAVEYPLDTKAYIDSKNEETVTNLSGDITDLKSAFEQLDANVITESAGPSPIVSIADGADGMPMRKVEVAIEPVQDLHGYEYPWPAGGGKNLFHATNNNSDYTTLDSDGIYTLHTVPSDSGKSFSIGTIDLKAGTSYILNGGSGTINFRLYLTYGGTTYISGSGDSNVITVTEDTTVSIFAVITTSATVGVKIKPMIRLATETDATFTPYSNICPITGRTGTKVTRCGKNLLDISRTVGTLSGSAPGTQRSFEFDKYYIGMSGNNYYYPNRIDEYYVNNPKGEIGITTGWSAYGVAFPIRVKPNTSYYITATAVKGSPAVSVGFFDKDGWYLSSKGNIANTAVTTPDKCAIMNIVVNGQDMNGVALKDLSINYPSEDHDYHEPHVETYEVTFPADPGTVYGGTLDVTEGKLTVDRAITDLGALSWQRTAFSYGYYYVATISDNRKANGDILCSAYKFVGYGAAALTQDCTISRSATNKNVFVRDDAYSTAEDFKTAVSGVQLCYYLENPISIQLDPVVVLSLLGENRIFADAGNTSVTYPADTKRYIDNRINSTRRLIAGIETGFTASKAYAVGDMLIIGDDLYKVASSIASGATITVGTNVTKTTVAEQLLALANA